MNISLFLPKYHLSGIFLKKDLIALKDVDICEYEDRTEIKGDKIVSIGPPLNGDISVYGLDDETPLSQRSFSQHKTLQIDLRIIDPAHASAVETHTTIPSSYISWEALMVELQRTKGLNHIHITGYAPDRDRTVMLGLAAGIKKFNLSSAQETHQFIMGLLYNAIEVVRDS